MLIKTSLLALPFVFFAGIAAAQPPSWPIVHGRHLQPTEREFDSLGDDAALQ